MAKTIIIDGNSLLFRAYYATAYGNDQNIMRTKEGVPTNAVFAFAGMIIKIISNFKNDEHILVGFDAHGKTFRHEEFEIYKANRKPCPEELIKQMPIAREFLDAMGIMRYEQVGVEGDDICGTYAKNVSKLNEKVNIFTSDRDFLQLIDDNIEINVIKKGLSDILIVNENKMVELYGFKPIQIIDFKGLRGDSSDNLPGIPGVGEKTATKLIQQYGNYENIIANAAVIGGKVGANLKEHQDIGKQSKHLAIIKTDVELPFNHEDTLYKGYEFDKINAFLQKYELKSILNRLPKQFKKQENITPKEIIIKEVDDIANLDKEEIYGIYLDKDDESYHHASIFGIAISNKDEVYYINKDKIESASNVINLLTGDYKKAFYDFKATKVILNKFNIKLSAPTFDLLLASYILDSSLKNDEIAIINFFGEDISFSEDNLDLFNEGNKEKSAKVAYFIRYLKTKAYNELAKNDSIKLYEDIELPLSNVLADMEIEGFPLDKNTLSEIGETFKEKLSNITNNIYSLAGYKFNIASPKQVATLLFDNLGLPNLKKGSTSNDVLTTLVEKHPIINELIEYRKYAKLISTYIDSLINHIHDDGKIHAMFNQALTTTGRLSSSEPNLQNISVRDEEGKLIRKAFFYPNHDYKILSLDYSQIELRILAALAKSKSFIDTFNNGEDVHALTAKNVFKLDKVNNDDRRRAKAINFGIVYGISDWGLSEQLNISIKDAKNIIYNFYNAYPEIKDFLQNIIFKAESDGYVTTYFGRRRYLREIHDSNYQTREFAKRAAMNAPIQGTAADLIKIAMIKIDKLIKEKNLKSRLVLQIHDELLFKVPREEEELFYKLAKESMEHIIDMGVNFEVDGGYGYTWYDAK